MKTALLVAGLLVVASCAKTKAPPPTCEAMGAAIVESFTSKVKPTDTEDAKQIAKRMAAMMSQRLVQHCKTDAWSAQLIACAHDGDVAKCGDLLTADQKAKLSADLPGQ